MATQVQTHSPPRPSKRRGRPIAKGSPGEDAALQARRERNREAQTVFRRRRQAAEAAQTKRLRRLEEVVEEMSSVFMGFVDDVLASEAARRDAGLVGTLQAATKRLLALASEVVGTEDDGGSEAAGSVVPQQVPGLGESSESGETSLASSPKTVGVYPAAPTAMEVAKTAVETIAPTVIVPDDLDMSFLAAAEFDIPNDVFPDYVTAPFITDITESLPQDQDQDQALIVANNRYSISIPPQVFGNGWGTFEMPRKAPASVDPHDLNTLPPLSPDSFAFRLVSSSMTAAFMVLSKSSGSPLPWSEEERIFHSTFQYRSRDELLARLRYLLGPGIRNLAYAADLPYGRWGEQVLSRRELTSGEEGRHTLPGPDKFLSVSGVEKQLIALGARMIDSDTIELDIRSPDSQSSSGETVLLPEPNLGQRDSWSFVDFFSADQLRPQTAPLKMQLSIEMLIHELTRRCICLLRGPGYPKGELGQAIQASIITASGGHFVPT